MVNFDVLELREGPQLVENGRADGDDAAQPARAWSRAREEGGILEMAHVAHDRQAQ